MLTIEDLRNPARKSGFDHVTSAKGGSKPGNDNARWGSRWRARAGRKDVRESPPWSGPARKAPEEAAQDYCDYVNGQTLLTIEDIRNPDRKSGFDHVTSATTGSGHRPSGRYQAWRAAAGGSRANGSKASWRGKTRRTPEEAAQDYCDYINGQQATAPATLKTAGHDYSKDKTQRDPEEEAALGVLRDFRAQREGRQGYVYCIAEPIEVGQNAPYFVKIGYSVNPEKRVAELQTGNPRVLRLLGTIEGTPEDERALHRKYAKFNELQEWFRPPGTLLDEFGIEWKGAKTA